MWYLLEFLAKKYHYLLFLLLETIGFALLFKGNSYQGSVWLSSANDVSGKCYELTSQVSSYFSLREVNRQLTQENALLSRQLSDARCEVDRLMINADSTLTHLDLPTDYHIVSAQVVQNSVSHTNNLLTINRGANEGVRRNMGVVSGTGVVGIVYLVGEHYSVVIPILNSHSNISCMVRGKGYFGYLNWDGKDPRYAYMDDVPRYAQYNRGDTIETSGYSSVFPQGLTIGRILDTQDSPDGLSYRIRLELATDFARLSDVCVIDNSPAEEQLDVLRMAQDSLVNHQQ